MVIKETPIENSTIIAKTIGTSSQGQSTIEIKKPVAVFEKHTTIIAQQQAIPNVKNNGSIQESQPLINREEYIPNPLKRKKLQPLKTEIDPHPEELAQIVNSLYPERQIFDEQLLAQQHKSGTFEAIQNGVKFIGRLVGRDIKLDANKDENGNVEKITFESKLIAFSTQVKNE